jgi:RNA polymerase sigma-70 factor (ECF subfamily)
LKLIRCLQEIFIKIHRLIGQLKDENKLQAWIYQVARNTVYDYFRSQGRTTDLKVEEIEEVEEEFDNKFMAETIEDMVKMMDKMPAEYCEVLCLTELGGMSHKDYAEKTGISATAAKTRAFRARNMLKDMLMKCCHYQFDKYGTSINIQPAGCCCCCDEGCN